MDIGPIAARGGVHAHNTVENVLLGFITSPEVCQYCAACFKLECDGCDDSGTSDSISTPTPLVIPPIYSEQLLPDPAPLENGKMVYYSTQDAIILVGDEYMQTWQWKDNRWKRIWTEHTPPCMSWFVIENFPPQGKIILLGIEAYDYFEDSHIRMWEFDGTDWQVNRQGENNSIWGIFKK